MELVPGLGGCIKGPVLGLGSKRSSERCWICKSQKPIINELCVCVRARLCVYTMLWREGGFGAWWVFRPGGHQLDRSHLLVGQFPQTSLSILDHLLHRYMLLKRFPYLGLADTQNRKKYSIIHSDSV